MDNTGQQIQSSDTSPDARYIGVDIAKAHLDAWDSARPGAKRFPQDEAGLEAFVCWLSEESAPIAAVILEATGGYEEGCVRILLQANVPVCKVNPRLVRNYVRARGTLAKTDAIDAHMLQFAPREQKATQPLRTMAEDGRMTAPRRILPGTSYVVARRCTERRFYLTPTPALVSDFKYVLACAADTFDIELHAVVFMSNHYHLWLTDTSGLLPKFMHTLNRNLARVVKAHYPDIEGEVFDRQPYNALMVLGQEAATAELAYLLANPVKAQLVEHHHEWPGLITTGEVLEAALARGAVEETVPRPTHALRSLPARATYCITPYRPHALRGAAHQAEAARIMSQILEGALAEVATQEAAFAHERQLSGRKVVGLGRLARQSHLERPAMSSEPPQPESVDEGAVPKGALALALAPSRYDTFRRITGRSQGAFNHATESASWPRPAA